MDRTLVHVSEPDTVKTVDVFYIAHNKIAIRSPCFMDERLVMFAVS